MTTCGSCERCTWNPGPDCGRSEHPRCPRCGHCDLVPRIERSGFVMSLVPRGETDVKFAVELGVSIMLGKPFMAVIDQNTPLPEKLAAVLDEIVRVDLEDLDSYRDEIEAAVLRMTERTGGAEGDDPSGELDSWTG
jgi:hypothetical protein